MDVIFILSFGDFLELVCKVIVDMLCSCDYSFLLL